MQQVTPSVFTSTEIRGCNPSYVVTSAGVVVVDTPQLPTKAVAMRQEAEQHGPIRYVINTEHHVDHIFGNYWFKGAGEVVHHQGVADNFMVPTPDLDPFDYAARGDPDRRPRGAAIVPDRDTYYEDPNRGDLVFTGDLELQVGDTTFHLIHTPGHTPGQVAVYVPEERVVFTGDTVFSECQTWLMTSDIDQWVGALDLIAAPRRRHGRPRPRAGDHAGATWPPSGRCCSSGPAPSPRPWPRAGRARRRSPGSTSATSSARSTSGRAT